MVLALAEEVQEQWKVLRLKGPGSSGRGTGRVEGRGSAGPGFGGRLDC